MQNFGALSAMVIVSGNESGDPSCNSTQSLK